MKKLKFFALLSLVMITSIMMVGCKNNNNNGVLDSAVGTQIKQDYFNQFVHPANNDAQLSDVQIYKYYGTFNGYVAIMFNDGARQAIGQETVAGITINYMDSRRILVWKDSNFYSLQESYDNSFLTEQNIRTIADAQNK